MNAVLELIINRRNELFYALDDARNDVPINDNEHYESDEYYETAIATLNNLIKEIEESDNKMNAEVIENLLAVIEKNQKESFQDWKDAIDAFDNPSHEEEFEDTLQRKYDEGYSDALKYVLELFADTDLTNSIESK